MATDITLVLLQYCYCVATVLLRYCYCVDADRVIRFISTWDENGFMQSLEESLHVET
jgi:hypothetical protein